MTSWIVEKIREMKIFILAASAAPLGYLLSSSCLGTGCAGCPASAGCSFTIPAILVGAVAVKSSHKIKNGLTRIFEKISSIRSI